MIAAFVAYMRSDKVREQLRDRGLLVAGDPVPADPPPADSPPAEPPPTGRDPRRHAAAGRVPVSPPYGY